VAHQQASWPRTRRATRIATSQYANIASMRHDSTDATPDTYEGLFSTLQSFANVAKLERVLNRPSARQD
jgi:hypothetical protein